MTVYFINELGGRCCIKIGYTSKDNIEERLKGLQTGNSSELAIFGEIPDGSRQLERAIQMHFADYYVRGEWFDIPDEALEPFMYEWVWPWPDEEDVMAFLRENMPSRIPRSIPVDEYDPDMWRIEKRTYTKKSGEVSTYYNYRRRSVHFTDDGRMLVDYKPGGKK